MDLVSATLASCIRFRPAGSGRGAQASSRRVHQRAVIKAARRFVGPLCVSAGHLAADAAKVAAFVRRNRSLAAADDDASCIDGCGGPATGRHDT